MAFNPQGQVYRPDPLADTGVSQKPFQEAGVPKASGLVTTLLRLAMRRLPSRGFAATPQTSGVKPPRNAMTAGSHGALK